MHLQFAPFEDSDFQPLFVQVIVPLALNDTFTYRVPREIEELVEIGKRVVIQFGKRHIYTGIIESFHKIPPKEYQAKYIIDILDDKPTVTQEQLTLWKWISDYYMCSLGEVYDAAIPAHLKMKSQTVIVMNSGFDMAAHQLTDKEELILIALRKNPELTLEEAGKLLQLKSVMKVIKDLINKGLILLKEDIHVKYKPKTKRIVRINPDYDNQEALTSIFSTLDQSKNTHSQSSLLLHFIHIRKNNIWVDRSSIITSSGFSASSLKSLISKGILVEETIEVDRILNENTELKDFELTDIQNNKLTEINHAFQSKNVVLFMGVTGSGKTHIYIKLIEKVIQANKTVLYLLPEIALTKQLITRLKVCFGNKIGIYHSKMGNNERVEMYQKLMSGQYSIILGVRSSVFLPFRQLDLIIVDEEHEVSYKQAEPSPRYHARDSAIYLAWIHGAKVLLGSATPSFESMHNAEIGKYGRVDLLQRFLGVQLPLIEIIDLRNLARLGQLNGHLSRQLISQINTSLKLKEQVLLFQNRRGYAPVLECSECGQVTQCKNCDIPLTLHKKGQILSCHYCGFQTPIPKKCNVCGSVSLLNKGLGTERLEDQIELIFERAHITRMDLDTTKRKNAIEDIITDIETGKTDILVGTQMVSKGLDFDNIRLVGIVSADSLIHFPDFRSIERGFQMMFQVGGRSGRKNKQGKVFIQTYQPENKAFNFLVTHDYEGFYQSEIYQRQAYGYPPFSRIIKIIIRHPDLNEVKAAANELSKRLEPIKMGAEILGPEPSPIPRLRNKYYMQFIVKIANRKAVIEKVKKGLKHAKQQLAENKDLKKVEIYFDVDSY